jgi:hypothetical protein
MATTLIYPGQKGAPVALMSVLREAHEAARAERKAQIEARTKKRIPLDDTTDWQAVGEAIDAVAAAGKAKDSPSVALAARRIVEATEGNALEPIGDYEPSDALEGIVITMQVVADAQRRMWSAEIQAQWAARRDALLLGNIVAAQEALNAIDVVAERMVSTVVVKIDGIDGMRDTVADSMPGLVSAGLLTPLFQAARHFLDLPAPKALLCGQQQPST